MSDLTPVGRILGGCTHSANVLSRNEANGGIAFYCDDCRSWVNKQLGYEKHWFAKTDAALNGIDLENLPLVRRNIWRKCSGPCGKISFCEENHTAPRVFFGDSAEDFPKVWLCRECHEWWHRVLTPGLCTAYDAVFHAQQIIGYLGVDRAALLTRALIKLGTSKRAGVA